MNYVDGEYVDDILERVAREMPGNEIRIDFSVGTIEPSFPSNSKLNTSIEYWREWLPKLLSSQAVEIESLGPVVLR
jgi:hypothetical protein